MDALELLKRSRPLDFAERMKLAQSLEKGERSTAWLGMGSSKSFDVEAGVGDFMITTPTVDRVMDVVVPEGMDNKNFRKNPVVLWGHDDGHPPVGRSLHETPVEGSHVEAKTQFDRKNDPQGFNTQIFGMYADKTLNATSVRFIPSKFEKIMKEVEIDGNKSEQWTGGFEFQEWELVEYSMVGIPMNPDALRMAYKALEAWKAGQELTEDEDKVLVSLKDFNALRREVRDLMKVVEDFEREPSGLHVRRALDHQVALNELRELSQSLK